MVEVSDNLHRGVGIAGDDDDAVLIVEEAANPDGSNDPAKVQKTMFAHSGMQARKSAVDRIADAVGQYEGPLHNPETAKRSLSPEPFPRAEGDIQAERDILADKILAAQYRDEELGQGSDGGGKRFDKGKLRMELTLPEWEWALADVSTKGSYKYDEWNWLLGMKWSSMLGCIKRHVNKFVAGERYDGLRYDRKAGTTGCHHLAMAAWNCLALMTYDLRGLGEDDRATIVQAMKLLERVNAETSDLKE